MSIISLPNIYSNGEVIDAGQLNSNLSTIVNDYNGNITNANLSSSIAITDSKLNQITTASKVSGTALTGLASIPSGAGIIPAANLTFKNVSYPYVKVSNTQSSGTNGGSATTGSWQTSILNTTDSDTQSISTLSTNQLSLPAGTYKCTITSPFHQTNFSQSRLFNVTASAILLNGTSVGVDSATGSTIISVIAGIFTLNTTSSVSLQYQVGTHTDGSDLGKACSFGTEVYAVAEFTQVS